MTVRAARTTTRPDASKLQGVLTGARADRAERAAAAPPTVEPERGNAREGKVMELPQSTRYDAVVIGAGLIGLSCAWRARKRGLSVLVVDRADEPGAGTSGVAAGMLAPVTEADFGEEGPLRITLAGRERWPAFAAELEEATGLGGGYRPRRRRGAPPPPRAAALARPRLRVAHALALPRPRARPVAARGGRHPPPPRRPGRPARAGPPAVGRLRGGVARR